MKKAIALLGLLLLLTSCAGFKGAKLSRISLGMDKAQVIRQLGEPKGVGGSANVEILHYAESIGLGHPYDYYFVRLVDGKVESFGPETKLQRDTGTNPPLKTNK